MNFIQKPASIKIKHQIARCFFFARQIFEIIANNFLYNFKTWKMWALKISLKIIFSIFIWFYCFKTTKQKKEKHFFRLKMLSRGNFFSTTAAKEARWQKITIFSKGSSRNHFKQKNVEWRFKDVFIQKKVGFMWAMRIQTG